MSSKTGEGLHALKRAIVERLESLAVEAADSADAPEGEEVICAFAAARSLLKDFIAAGDGPFDIVIFANAVRSVAERLGEAVGAAYSTDMLERLFSRFCVGK